MASDFIPFGAWSISPASVSDAEFRDDKDNLRAAMIYLSMSSGAARQLSAEHPDAEKACKVFGLDRHYKAWQEKKEAAEHGQRLAQARAEAREAAEAAAAEARAQELAKHEAKVLKEIEAEAQRKAKARERHPESFPDHSGTGPVLPPEGGYADHEPEPGRKPNPPLHAPPTPLDPLPPPPEEPAPTEDEGHRGRGKKK